MADSFEMWARECAAAIRQERDFYVQFDEAVYASHLKWEEYEALKPKAIMEPKRWWKFWH